LESNGPAQPASVKPNRKAARSRVKNYVIDTNVLLHDPQALLNFQDNHVLIPIEVIEEIDRFKRDTPSADRTRGASPACSTNGVRSGASVMVYRCQTAD
jgi:hypothetical protein